MADSSYDEDKGARVLKTDVLGRVKTARAQREAMLDEFERSGLSGTKFAVVAGVNYQTFASWVQKRRRATGAYQNNSKKPAAKKRTGIRASALPALGWVEALVDSAAAPVAKRKAVLRVELPGGAGVLITDEAQAALAAVLLRKLQPSPAGTSC